MNFDYSDYTVIVTGGTRGIGRATAEAFIKAGATVVATYVGNDAAANKFKDEIASEKLHLAKFDIANYNEVEKFFAKFDKDFDSLDVLVNCAGIRRDSIVGTMSIEDWQKVIDINLTGTFSASKFALQKMMQNRFGRIISITSPSGKMGIIGQANYAATKAAQVAFTKTLAKEAAKRKITVNCVSPGFIETDLIADLPEDVVKEYKKSVPLKRFGKPNEVASGILFLSSKEAGYITGTTLEITGGLL